MIRVCLKDSRIYAVGPWYTMGWQWAMAYPEHARRNYNLMPSGPSQATPVEKPRPWYTANVCHANVAFCRFSVCGFKKIAVERLAAADIVVYHGPGPMVYHRYMLQKTPWYTIDLLQSL